MDLELLKQYEQQYTALTAQISELNRQRAYLTKELQASLGLSQGAWVTYRDETYRVMKTYFDQGDCITRCDLTKAKADGSMPLKQINGRNFVSVRDLVLLEKENNLS